MRRDTPPPSARSSASTNATPVPCLPSPFFFLSFLAWGKVHVPITTTSALRSKGCVWRALILSGIGAANYRRTAGQFATCEEACDHAFHVWVTLGSARATKLFREGTPSTA